MTDPLTTAVRNLATTLAQNEAAQHLCLHVDEQYQAAIDDGLNHLISAAAQMADTIGPEYARERLSLEFAAQPEKTAALLAAALVRLAGAA